MSLYHSHSCIAPEIDVLGDQSQRFPQLSLRESPLQDHLDLKCQGIHENNFWQSFLHTIYIHPLKSSKLSLSDILRDREGYSNCIIT